MVATLRDIGEIALFRFINLKHNPHLDSAYGGYAVFANVEAGDAASFATIDAIAVAVAQKGAKPGISGISLE